MSDLKVVLKKEAVHSVLIYGGFDGPFIDLEISPAAVLSLLQELDKKREELKDMVENYYDCPDCGETHPNSVPVCPNVGQEE